MITIDGSTGEGGGQILRTALSLSMTTGIPVTFEHIRAKRSKPGLMRQHLTSVLAAAKVCDAQVKGAELGSKTLVFEPGEIKPGAYEFAVGTAGSTSLVLQTVLPALMLASKPSSVVCRGGTHNPLAPTAEFLSRSFFPLISRMGPSLELKLDAYGFYPAGGGQISVAIEPVKALSALLLHERGEELSRQAMAIQSNLSERVVERELDELRKALRWPDECFHWRSVASAGPGNVIWLALEYEKLTAIMVAFGAKSKSSEQVAGELIQEYRDYLSAQAPCGEFLTDQLLLPLALAKGGSLRCSPPSRHTRTNMEIIEKFIEIEFVFERVDGRMWQIDVEA